MSATFENLRILQCAEEIADRIWHEVVSWEAFSKDVVGKQLARSADSIGANIAESFGRFHFGEKLQFLYYARGSLFETKYWLNRASKRNLMVDEIAKAYIKQLTSLARQLNAFTNGLKSQRRTNTKSSKSIRELPAMYTTNHNQDLERQESFIDTSDPLFNENELNWLASTPQNETDS